MVKGGSNVWIIRVLLYVLFFAGDSDRVDCSDRAVAGRG